MILGLALQILLCECTSQPLMNYTEGSHRLLSSPLPPHLASCSLVTSFTNSRCFSNPYLPCLHSQFSFFTTLLGFYLLNVVESVRQCGTSLMCLFFLKDPGLPLLLFSSRHSCLTYFVQSYSNLL